MDIGNYYMNNFDNGVQGYVQPEQTKDIHYANTIRSSDDITALREGTVFKGEVLDITGDRVTIELENQETLLARLQEGVELGIGDRLFFSVKENHNNQILIKPLFDSLYSAKNQTLEKILEAANLSPTERNFTAVKELMDAGMPIDKRSIVKILSQSMKFEGTSLQTLVALNKMDIPVTKENIAQFERYQNGCHQLSGDITKTAQSIANFVHDMPLGTSAEEFLSLTESILNIFSEETNVVENSNAAYLPENMDEMEHVNAKGISSFGEENVMNPDDGEVISGEQKGNILKEIKSNTTGEEDIPQRAEPETEKREPFEKFGLSKESLDHFSQILQKAGISQEQLENIFQKADSPENLLRMVTKTLTDCSIDKSAVPMVFSSDEFKEMLSDIVKNGWSMDPKTMKDPKEIDRLYEKIAKQSRAFEELLSAKGGDTGQFEQNSQNMRQNMSFVEQLNHQMIYAQLPLKLNNQNVNSELYVYADKRKLAEKKDGISIMLHLDMDHLGMTDIKVTLTGNNVNARFYLNDQKSVEIVTDNMEQLKEKIDKRGFTFSNEVVERHPAESINKVVDEIMDENAEKSIKRYTFDVKM